MALTIGGLLLEARGILNDTGMPQRYTDLDLISAFNEGLIQARTKRPDVFLDMGLRNPTPQYIMPNDSPTKFPFDQLLYPALLYYITARSELREDTFTDDKRAELLLQRFTALLMGTV